MTDALQPYRGSHLMPAFERASVAAGIAGDDSGGDHLVWGLVSDTAHLIVTSGGQPAGVVSSLDLAGALAWGRS